MRSYCRISLLLSMIQLLFAYGKTQSDDQCRDWCNLENCNGEQTTVCEGTNSRLLTSLFPILQNQDRVVNIFFIRTTDVMLEPYTFYNASLISLEAISISQAPLRTIADGAFAGLPLQSLILSSTQLEAFSVSILEGLDPSMLQRIDLTDSQIRYLSSDLLPFLSNMPADSTIDLMGNPLVCDCHMSWVSQLPVTVMIQDAICMEPVALQGQSLLSVLPQLNQTCPDVCSTNLNNCPMGTNCSQGSYPVPLICICQPGVSDITECVDIDECATSRPCAPTEICINTRTSYMCYNCTPTAIVNTNSTTYDCELCPQGFIANLTENYCQRCPIGTIVDIPNNTCLECPPGSIANTTENYCQQCTPTSIVDRINNECQECPQGYIANISLNYCQECPLRSIVDIPNNQCQECPAGSIANSTGNYCQQCPPTSIVDRINNECQECPQGYIANISLNYCQECPLQSIVDISNNRCQECHPGSTVNFTSNYCQDCPLGSIVNISTNQCQLCPQGFVANITANLCQMCPLGSIVNVYTNKCQRCSLGSVADISGNLCQRCPLGSIANISNNQCQQCPLGSIANITGNYCQDCPVGFIANASENVCQRCPLGSTVNISNNQCQQCPLGSIANITGNYCQACPVGFIANASENVCQRCPLGSTVNISNNQCQQCPLGSVANITGNYCQDCPLGFIANISVNVCQRCPLGSIVNISNNQCQQCSLGSIANITINKCQKCPMGFIANISENLCQECPLGSIVNLSNNQCQRCPQGMIANITSNSCRECPQGHVVAVALNRCQMCPQGSVVNITSNHCQMCANNTIANTTTNMCQSCPPRSIANVTSNRCQVCPEGLISDSTTNQCQACPNRSVVDGVNNKCQRCPPGSIANSTNNFCQPCPNRSIVNVEANQCQACPQRMIANATSNTCEECPPHSVVIVTSNICQRCSNIAIVDITNNRCQVCPHGMVGNIVNNRCELCPNGSHFNSETLQCQTCPANFYFNLTANACETCPEGSYLNTTANQCMRCPVGTQYNDTALSCVACLVGEAYNTETASCRACSDSGMIYDSSTQACQFCPSLTEFKASTRMCQPCEHTAVYHASDHACFDCSPLSMIPNDDRTMCISCEQGTIFNDTTETCQFCPNMMEYNPTSMTCVDCPRNTQYNRTTRLCNACPEAKLYNVTCVQCGPNLVVNNLTGQCETCPGDLVLNPITAECECTCPNNTICFEEKFCACPTGMIRQADLCINVSGMHCIGEVLDDTLWNAVESDTVVSLPCPFTTGRFEMQTRLCQNNGLWGAIDISDCPSQEIVKLWKDSSTILNANISETDLANFANTLTQTLQATPPASGDLPIIHDLLSGSVAVFNNVQSHEAANNISQDIVLSLSVLFSSNSSMAWMNATNSSELLTSLTVTLDMLGSELVRFAENESVLVDAPGIVLQVVAISPNSNEEINITLPSLYSTSGLSYIVLPADIINDITIKGNDSSMCQLGVVSTAIEDLGSLLLPQGEFAITPPPPSNPRCGDLYMVATGPPIVNSVVLSSFIASPNCEVNTSDLNLPVLITLQHDEIQHGNPQCVFLNIENAAWSGDGCSVRQRGPNYTVCQCNHLTSFAIVMNPEGAETSTDHHLRTASKVGLALSIIALMASMLMLLGLGVKDTTYLYKIHGNLAIALSLAQGVFLVGVDRVAIPSPDSLCTIIAILLHYLLLATWAWMLVEGVHLYMMVVRIFYNRKIFYFYWAAAWGTPIVIVAITLGSRLEDYGTECFCWIDANNDNHGTIWSFHGPAIAIICINTFILILTIAVVVKVQRRVESAVVRSAFRATLVLLPVLGITWALGFLVVTTETETIDTIIEWLFFSFNTLQGVIFFFLYCLSNRELRLGFLKKFGCRQVAIDIEREVSWTRRPSMQITSALQWARRASMIDSSRKHSRRDSNTSNHSDSSNPALYNFNPRPSLLVSRLQETLAEAEEDSLENFELNQIDDEGMSVLNVDPATGEVLFT